MVVVLPVPALASTAVIPSRGRLKTSRPSVMRRTARSPRTGPARRVRGRGTRGRVLAGERTPRGPEPVLRMADGGERAFRKEGQRAVEPLPVELRERAERVEGRRDR